MTAIFVRVDSTLVNSKGYDHSKVSSEKLDLGPPPPNYPPPLPDAEGHVAIDVNDENTKYPEPELPKPRKEQTEEEILDEILADMANYEARNAKAASLQLAEGPPPPTDAPPPLPVGVKEPSKAPEAPVEQKTAEE